MNQPNKETKEMKKPKVESYDIAKSDETLHLATDLAKFIKENRLFQNIQGKEYVNVEGWQYAGSRLGILPVVEHVVNISTDDEIKYQAKVNLLDLRSQLVVGAGFAICSNREQGKKYYQEFAIASMAQTRAIGKAYRNILAWVIRAAGYEPTPSEEMDYGGNEAAAKPAVPTEKKATMKSSREAAPAAEAEKPEEPSGSVRYASAKQKEEIIRLLNNPTITRQEKTKMLLNINRFDEERAAQAIDKLKKVIEEREDGQSAAA
ncbi:hypothetical protein C8N40_106301 [Pontibacter mucosus]|uniref:Uncharacterized protein n=1 Tax=Pontibacter mucosus TaxID=1649266 RepID=A0A2T5YGS7_9BACT|nr:hypothetical protein [Pontibacter mucosus]PTX18501.1 hypothetical protein C8N40_106301 [Pontibacter mucosus]